MNEQINPSLLVEQKRVEAILKNKNTAQYWEEKKNAHEEVQKSLEHYGGKLQEHIMVPVGKRGLMKGRIVNTNQVFVSLGGGWFIKVCAAEAQEVCSRRISECNEMLDKLEKERKLLDGWTTLSNKQVFATEGSKEIIEPYNEDEEDKWRKQHAEKVKEHKKKLAEVRQQLEESRCKEKNSEDELWRRLELLELQEEFEEELDRLGESSGSENETVSPLDSDDDSESPLDSYPEEEEDNRRLSKDNRIVEKKIITEIKENSSNVEHHPNQVAENKEGLSDRKKSIIQKSLNNSQTNKTKNPLKKVTFAPSDSYSENDHVMEDKTLSTPKQRETITLGEVIEHSSKYQQTSKDSRPISKFRSSKLASRK